MVFIVCAHTTPLPLIFISNIMKEPRRSSSRKMNRTIARAPALSLLLDFELKKDPLVSLGRGEEREIKREIEVERERDRERDQ